MSHKRAEPLLPTQKGKHKVKTFKVTKKTRMKCGKKIRKISRKKRTKRKDDDSNDRG